MAEIDDVMGFGDYTNPGLLDDDSVARAKRGMVQHHENVEDARDTGPPPPIVDLHRREACKDNLELFLTEYSPDVFYMSFSDAHRQLIDTVQQVLTGGGQFVTAMPRGSGKTSIMQRALIWATFYGHRLFPLLLCSDAPAFKRLLDGIKVAIETTEAFYEDFPEIVHPVRHMERSFSRAPMQRCCGQDTFIIWKSDRIVFPTTEWSKRRGNAGCSITGGGLGGSAIRGQVLTLPDGRQIRPDAVLVDDPQTRRTAASASQCQSREDTLKGDVLGMAGPGRSISLMVACTVIYREDLADRLLDPERSPQFRSQRVSMVESWPTSMDLWEKYADLRRSAMIDKAAPDTHTKYYAENRARMDEGGKVYWDERIDPGFTTALESAMADYFTSPRAFMAEKQNNPDLDIASDLEPLSAMTLVRRVSPYPRHKIAPNVEVITAHIDVQQHVLYYAICGWTRGYGGYVIDYGTNPKQNSSYFKCASIQGTLVRKYVDADIDDALRSGIVELVNDLNARIYHRDDGAELTLDRGLIDCRYKAHIVEDALMHCQSNNWTPALGLGIGAKETPIKLVKAWKGLPGNYWVVQKSRDRMLRSVFVDTNHWKTEVHTGLSVPQEHAQAIQLFSTHGREDHQMFADHCCSEHATRVEAKGRKIDEWSLPPSHPDNHYFDNLVGCTVAANIQGIKKADETTRHAVTAARNKRRTRRLRI